MDTILDELKELIKNRDKNGFLKKIKELTPEQKEFLEKDKERFISVEGHLYSGYNLYSLAFADKGYGTYGTYVQWKKTGRKVKQGAKAIHLICPIFDKEEKEIKFWKTIYVFHESDTYYVEKIPGEELDSLITEQIEDIAYGITG